jgi:hypothetical protein
MQNTGLGRGNGTAPEMLLTIATSNTSGRRPVGGRAILAVLLLIGFAIALYALPEILFRAGWRGGAAPNPTLPGAVWHRFHNALGILAGFSTLLWLVLLVLLYRRYKGRVLWALLAAPLVLYWNFVWLIGCYTASFL